MDSLQRGWLTFVSQPWGVVGALCIMFAVTAFNSERLKARLARWTPHPMALSALLNGFNLVGGACLLINAWIRDEAVWIVLEVYFVAIAVKGLLQLRGALGEVRRSQPHGEKVVI